MTQSSAHTHLQLGGPQAYFDEQKRALKTAQAADFALTRRSAWHPAQLAQEGWYLSRKNRICDGQGQPRPWYTYPATHALAALAQSSWQVLEYGLGSSSLWWAERIKHLWVIEHDPAWIQAFAPRLPANVTLVEIPQDAPHYLDFLLGHPGAFDLVSIDAKRRNSIVKRAVKAAKPQSFILFDDSQKLRYVKALAKVERKGFHRWDFWGPKPLQAYVGKTSLFQYMEETA